MIYANRFCAAILAAKPSGVLLANYPLAGLPQPQFNDALINDARERLFCSIISLGEALRDLKDGRTSWPTVKLYYSAFYSLEAILACDKACLFFINKTYYIADTITGSIRKTGTSSHQIKWSVFSQLPRLNRWTYSDQTGAGMESLKSFREAVNYKSDFKEPKLRPELPATNRRDIEKLFRKYYGDKDLFYTFLSDHIALSLPVRIAREAWESCNSQAISLSDEQKAYAKRLWPFQTELT